MNYIFIDTLKKENRVGLVEKDRLVEFHVEEGENRSIGNIYRGRAINVLRGMESAFIDIGQSKNAYLYVKDALPIEYLYDGKKYSIWEVIKAGQEVIVQVSKEAYGNKGAKITTHIEIPGRYLVFTPFSDKINISKKVKDFDELTRLKTIGEKIRKENMGMIFRTASELVEEDILQEEYEILYDIYKKIEREKNFLPCPKLLYKEPSQGYQIIRDELNNSIDKIIVNSKETYNDLIMMEEFHPFKFSHKIELDTEYSIDYDTIVQRDLAKALDRKVKLTSGGYIVIDETEALIAIDVNTGKFVGNKSLEDTIYRTNIEATEEIARQIRLRDIAGIIIVDFIDMKNKDNINKVLAELKSHLRKYRAKTNIIDITKLGLVELTRKKTRKPLSETRMLI